MNVLVTGGTGFVGGHVVPRLLTAGHDVRVLARGAHVPLLPGTTSFVPGDVASGDGLDGALDGIDAVIHLVAVIRQRGEFTFDRVNHLGTANVIAAMRRRGVSRLLHVSYLGAAPDPHLPYIHSKWLGEQVVRHSDLDFTIFRPSLIFGSNGSFLDRLRQSIAPVPFFVLVPGTGRTRFQPIWVEDVATCLLLALDEADRVGQACDLGGPEHLAYDQIVDVVVAALGLRRVKLHVPLSLLLRAASMLEPLTDNPPVTAAELTLLGVDAITSLDSVVRSFGFPPAHLSEKVPAIFESPIFSAGQR